MGEVWFLGFGGLSLRPEGPKIEVLSARPEGPRVGVGLFFPPAKGLRERCKLPQRGPGQSPGRKRILDVEDPIKRIGW